MKTSGKGVSREKASALLREHKAVVVVFAAAALYFLFAPLSGYLDYNFPSGTFVAIHSGMEAVSVAVALLCFGITWHSHLEARNYQNLFLGVAFLGIGLIDVFHALSYSGMPDFITPNTVDKATKLWIAARLLGAAAFFASAFISPVRDYPRFSPAKLLLTALWLAAGVFFWIIYAQDRLPAMYVPGAGLTPLKVRLEYLIVFLNFSTAALFLRLYVRTGQYHLFYFIVAMVISAFSELFFTLYASPFDIYNLMGHVYKVAAYLFVYQMLFATSIRRPYQELKKTQLELNEYTRRLEDMVAERTEDLADKNRELERLSALKTEFLAMCSHDIKSPLQGSSLLIELLLAEAEGSLNEEQKKSLEAIRQNEEEILGLITNLLDMTSQEEGGLRLETKTVDFRSFVESWAGKQAHLAEKKKLNFRFGAWDPPEAALVEVDIPKMTQVLNNLSANAMKFTPPGGEIRLTLSREGAEGWLRVSLFNSGPAIPKEKLGRIFERYVRSGESPVRGKEGTGLGLSIAKGIVELHGGRIWAESEEHIGNTFHFTVPPGPPPA